MNTTRVTIWNENRHEQEPGHPAGVMYSKGIHAVLAEMLDLKGFSVRTATLDEPEHGLSEPVLEATDVLLWWGHCAHNEVSDEVVERVQERIVEGGMGLIVLHSGHFSKIFKRLMGTTCNLLWREVGERERVWVIEPGHPIAAGLPAYFEVPHSEMYGERFDIPAPDTLVFASWFQGGEVFRSGCCWHRGRGKVFYFSPGHESHPIYRQQEIQQVIANAAHWAAPSAGPAAAFGKRNPIEKIS